MIRSFEGQKSQPIWSGCSRSACWKSILASALFVVGAFCLDLPARALAQSTVTNSISHGYDNPVIPGMAPDPSVCRVGDDYYLVTSTFEYFPGVPVYHSKDLIHWRMISYSLSRPSQLPLLRLTRNGGIWAATIRYHDGTFYVVTSRKKKKGPLDTNTRFIGGTYEEKPNVWREASPITQVNRKSAPVLFINSSSYRPFQQREEMSANLKALGIVSEIVVVPDTPHPFWLFHPWFDSTIRYVDEFLKKTMADRSVRGVQSRLEP